MTKPIGILGYGEVGRAIHEFIPNAIIGDKDRPITLYNFSFLHICIPWQKDFVEIVSGYNADVVIIHSSVPVGTTEKISNAVHSPVRGVHPHLYEGIKTHRKFIGANSPDLGEIAYNHLTKLGITCEVFHNSRTTELGKILDTTRYGIEIEYHRYAKKLCDKYGVEFENAVTEMDESYNIGYQKLGLGHFTRSVLYPPMGDIGGHCVRQNAQFLPKFNPKMVWKK